MFKRWFDHFGLHAKTHAVRLWAFIKAAVRHPWQSLVSFFAWIGGLVFRIFGWVWVAILWMWSKLKAAAQRPSEAEVRRLLRAFLVAVTVVLVTIFLGIAFLVYYPSTQAPNFQAVDQHVYFSDGPGWSGGQNEPLRQLYYFTPQGTTVKNLPYSWFVALEVPLGKQKFTSPERMNAYGFLVDSTPTKVNPDSLPVGFTSHFEPQVGQRVLDITCAACHTGELAINKNGKRFGLRVDGGGAMHAFTTTKPGNFTLELLASMTSTYLNPFKFDRFARQVLGPMYPGGYFQLHGDLRRMVGAFLKQAAIDNNPADTLYPTIEGPGRTDALARIGNTVFGTELSDTNYRVGNSPVRYPPLWDIWKFDYVQYNSSVRQPMARNLGESLGVGAVARLLNPYGAPVAPEDRYVTTSLMGNLHRIETALWSLEPPRWSEDCFGSIDWDKAAKGQKLFAATCAQCHGPFPADDVIKQWKAPLKVASNGDPVARDWSRFLKQAYPQYAQVAYSENSEPWSGKNSDPFPLWVMHPLTVQDIGTDPRAAVNFVEKQIDLTKLGLKPGDVTQTLRDLFQEDLRLEIRARAKEIALQSKDNEVRAAADSIAQTMQSAIDAGNLRQPLAAQELQTIQPKAALIRSKLTTPQGSESLQAQAIALDQRIASGQMPQKDLRAEIVRRSEEIAKQSSDKEVQSAASKIARTVKASTSAENSNRPLTAAEVQTLQAKSALIRARLTSSGSNEYLQSMALTLYDRILRGQPQIDSTVDSVDLKKANTGLGLSLVGLYMRDRFYQTMGYDQAKIDMMNGFGQIDLPVAMAQYKPRPLAGIWAAGPFLHNGSVPTIYQLLLPASRRDTKFWVGTREFDSKNLGLSTQPAGKGGFLVDTTITGNANIGHEFRKGYMGWHLGSPPQYGVIGAEFTEEERWQIIEYLKIHRDTHKVQLNLDGSNLRLYLEEGLDRTHVCQ